MRACPAGGFWPTRKVPFNRPTGAPCALRQAANLAKAVDLARAGVSDGARVVVVCVVVVAVVATAGAAPDEPEPQELARSASPTSNPAVAIDVVRTGRIESAPPKTPLREA